MRALLLRLEGLEVPGRWFSWGASPSASLGDHTQLIAPEPKTRRTMEKRRRRRMTRDDARKRLRGEA